MIRVLLAEDHETVREGLRLLLNAQPDMRVIAEASDGDTAVTQAQTLKPNVVVLDLTMPGMNGLSAARQLHESAPSTAVVALTRHDDNAFVQALLDAGASGYVLKRSSSTELLRAIRTAVAGGCYVDPAVRDDIAIKQIRTVAVAKVSPRETEVSRHMALGHSNKEIAAALDISVKTVEVHKSNGMRKLGLNGRADVVRYAALNGWLQDP